MTCTCKAQFCYVCGLRWRTCACSDAQLQSVLQAANTRRAAAQAQERETEAGQRAAEAEAAELAEILQEIENYELEEAARLAREEEELRLAVIANRQRRQEEHVTAVSKKYFDFRNELDFLHALQKVAMAERYEEEIRMRRTHANMRTAMLARHATKLKIAQSLADAKISDSLFVINQEKQRRLAGERAQENEYRMELQDYYRGRPNSVAGIAAGMEPLRKRNVESYELWVARKREKHQQIVAAVNEEVAKVRRNHELEMAEIESKIKGSEEDVQARRTTDNKWFEAVSGVRTGMLEEMEEQEYALEQEFD